ncbi:hypothetical protein EDD22DRAFT_560392 [Suillus occidentalis]|nr:hypothetical protein EDD22DRAFT_560392 [Suillus occidentalis]
MTMLLPHAVFPLWTSSQLEANIALLIATLQKGTRNCSNNVLPVSKPGWCLKQQHAPPAGTSNVVGGATPATLHTESTSAASRPSFPLERVPAISCFAVLKRCFPRLSRIPRNKSICFKLPLTSCPFPAFSFSLVQEAYARYLCH